MIVLVGPLASALVKTSQRGSWEISVKIQREEYFFGVHVFAFVDDETIDFDTWGNEKNLGAEKFLGVREKILGVRKKCFQGWGKDLNKFTLKNVGEI
jgi:hypothetical protein